MATSGYPALSIRPTESPLQIAASVAQLQSAQQERQLGALQIQQKSMEVASTQALQKAYIDNKGDIGAILANPPAGALPQHLLELRNSDQQFQLEHAKLTEAQLTNEKSFNSQAGDILQSTKAVPQEQRVGYLTQQRDSLLASSDPLKVNVGQHIAAALQQVGVSGPTDDFLNQTEAQLGMREHYATQELENKKTAASTGQALAETDKAIQDALKTHADLLNMPSPTEARTTRTADLLRVQAQTAEANASTAQKIAETAMIKAKPVFAVDPATGQRVLTTMPQAGQQGLTNPISAAESDVKAESELTRQWNVLQSAKSNYQVALNNLSNQGQIEHPTALTFAMQNKELLGKLGEYAGGATTALINDTLKAKGKGSLNQEEIEALVTYQRLQAAIPLAAKALSGSGRMSQFASELEAATVPSPIEGSNTWQPALKGMQTMIDNGSAGLVRVPWLKSTAEVRSTIEQNPMIGAGALASAAQQNASGQYRNASGRQMQVGQDAYDNTTKRFIGKVTRVYPNGSYDVSM